MPAGPFRSWSPSEQRLLELLDQVDELTARNAVLMEALANEHEHLYHYRLRVEELHKKSCPVCGTPYFNPTHLP